MTKVISAAFLDARSGYLLALLDGAIKHRLQDLRNHRIRFKWRSAFRTRRGEPVLRRADAQSCPRQRVDGNAHQWTIHPVMRLPNLMKALDLLGTNIAFGIGPNIQQIVAALAGNVDGGAQ